MCLLSLLRSLLKYSVYLHRLPLSENNAYLAAFGLNCIVLLAYCYCTYLVNKYDDDDDDDDDDSTERVSVENVYYE